MSLVPHSARHSVLVSRSQSHHVTAHNMNVWLRETNSVPYQWCFLPCCSIRSHLTNIPTPTFMFLPQIRGLAIDKALIQMELSPKKAAKYIREVLKDTQLRAERTFNLDPHKLYIGMCDIICVCICMYIPSKFSQISRVWPSGPWRMTGIIFLFTSWAFSYYIAICTVYDVYVCVCVCVM